MKKLPIIMSAIAVFASGSGMLLARTVLADTETKKTDILHMEANIYEDEMSVTQIDPERGMISFYPGVGGGGWDTARFVFAQPNYEAGASIADSDQALANLGVQDDERLVVLHDQSLGDQEQSTQWRVNLGDTLKKNKSDRIYYAVEHGRRKEAEDGTVSWEGTWWERGIIDYRSCVHSVSYNAYTTICNQVFRTGMQKYDFAVANNENGSLLSQPESENVVSWDDEWRQIQRERVEKVQDDLMALKNSITNFEAILDGSEATLEKLDVTLAATAYTEDLQYQVGELKRLLAELKALMQKYDITEKDAELEHLGQEIARLEKEQSTLLDEKMMLTEKVQTLEREVAEQKQKNVALENEMNNTEKEVQVVEKVNTEIVMQQTPQENIDSTKLQQTDNTVEKVEPQEAQETAVADGTVADVPALGEVETRFNFWWFLIPGVLLAGAILFGWRKLRER